jgi:N-acetylmuramoyl-L-alanine amidase
MTRSRVRPFKRLGAVALLLALLGGTAGAQQQPLLWFQGTRLIFEHAAAEHGELAVSTGDGGLRRFLDRLGATLAFEPQSRYVIVTSQDRRTIVFSIGDPSYTVDGVRLRAAFAARTEGPDAVLPFFALARALYVEAVPAGAETVLQPRLGALDVRADGTRTFVTVRAAMPLLTTTNADSAERLQLTFTGQGSSLAAARRPAGGAVEEIDVAVGGTPRVPTTTVTLAGAPGTTHRIVAGDGPDTITIIFEPRADLAQAPPSPSAPPAEGGAVPTATPPLVAGRSTVTDLAITQTSDDALSVRLTLSAAAAFEWHRLLDHRWYLDLANTTLTGPGRDEHPSFGAVASVRVRQTGTSDAPSVRVAFTLSGEQQIAIEPDATGLTIVVTNVASVDPERIGYGRTGGPPVVPSAVAEEPSPSPAPWKFEPGSGSSTIVIDPGHGGDDTGTAHNGLVEKTLTLDIARRLRALLAAQGWTVRLTRDSDIDPVSNQNLAQMRADGKPNADDRAYLQTRCDVANAAGARLFISIHANSAPFASARGTTFYWFKPQDLAFAQALERSVIPVAGTQDDGTRHENFYVVRHTTMPAVLIETAFVTNPADAELLHQPSFLQNMAQGIANGVRAFAGTPSASSLSAQ